MSVNNFSTESVESPRVVNALSLEGEGETTSNDETGGSIRAKAGLCWQTLINKHCKYGDYCKNHHLSLDQLLQSKLSLSDNEDVEPSNEEPDRSNENTRQVQKKLDAALYKTKLCLPYQTNFCKNKDRCSYIHMTGPDAKAIVGEHFSFCRTRNPSLG